MIPIMFLLNDKRKSVRGIVRQCSLLLQVVNLREGKEQPKDLMSIEARLHSCFQTFLLWVTLRAQQTGTLYCGLNSAYSADNF